MINRKLWVILQTKFSIMLWEKQTKEVKKNINSEIVKGKKRIY